MSELWRPVVGYEGVYEVSNLGAVRRTSAAKGTRIGHVLRPRSDGRGYAKVALMNHGRKDARVGVLVAEAFISPRPAGCVVNHINGDKSDNRHENLEWVTQGENVRHAVALGLSPRGERVSASKLTESDVLAIRELRGVLTQRETAALFRVDKSQIARIHSGERWSHVEREPLQFQQRESPE